MKHCVVTVSQCTISQCTVSQSTISQSTISFRFAKYHKPMYRNAHISQQYNCASSYMTRWYESVSFNYLCRFPIKFSTFTLLNVKWVWRGLIEVKTKQFFYRPSLQQWQQDLEQFHFIYIPLFSDRIPILERKPQDTAGSKEKPAVLPKKG